MIYLWSYLQPMSWKNNLLSWINYGEFLIQITNFQKDMTMQMSTKHDGIAEKDFGEIKKCSSRHHERYWLTATSSISADDPSVGNVIETRTLYLSPAPSLSSHILNDQEMFLCNWKNVSHLLRTGTGLVQKANSTYSDYAPFIVSRRLLWGEVQNY